MADTKGKQQCSCVTVFSAATAIEVTCVVCGGYKYETLRATTPSSAPPPRPLEQFYVVEAGGDGAVAKVVPESALKQELHAAMCCCDAAWSECETADVRDDIQQIDDDENWTKEYPDYQRFACRILHDQEDGSYVRVVRLTEPLAARAEAAPQSQPPTPFPGQCAKCGQYRQCHLCKEDIIDEFAHGYGERVPLAGRDVVPPRNPHSNLFTPGIAPVEDKGVAAPSVAHENSAADQEKK